MSENTVLKQVSETIRIKSLFNRGDRVIVGLSGGADSVCLLHVLLSLSTRFDLTIFAIHINHMLRGPESDQDEEYVTELCEKLGVKLLVKQANIKETADQKGLSIEEAGREARYELFDIAANEVNASRIAVAHNKNDQAETLLMRMIRGTGLEGLKGIEHKRGSIVRPLLDVSRKEIEAYCEQYDLKPRTDSSNLESIYTRNRIRLDLIPGINKLFNTDITETFYRMANLLKEDNEYIEENAVIIYNQCILNQKVKEIRLDISKILSCHTAISKRIIRMAVKHVKGNTKGIESIHIDKVLEAICGGKTGVKLHLPCGVRIKVSYNELIVTSGTTEEEPVFFEKSVNIPGVTTVPELNLRIEAELVRYDDVETARLNEKSFIQIFDFDKLSKGINIRNRRNGDVFKPLKSNGTKKLKEYFIDNKFPRDLRNELPMIAYEKEIVWIVGYKISDKFTVTENTKSVLKLTCVYGSNK